ncbi:MAG: D-aminoacylase [Gammaproteobacteria bacterium]|jgi:N-acyl-D-amino-acid deacylase|nr:D-aminoacylase [Gammaproteobacteria bacterium]
MKKIIKFLSIYSICFISLISINANAQESFDILILNGQIIDGTGNPWFEADVGIIDQHIVSIGNLEGAQASRIIDATGLIVSPGFIDPHTHAIRGIFDNPTAESSLRQGITTLLEGNDGSSPFPIDEHYQAIRDRGISTNWSTFVGQGTIREIVMGLENRAANASELQQMKNLVAEAMQQGAMGISTGLFYVPGNYTPTEEVVELSRVVADYDGIYISHMRDEVDGLFDSVNETILIGEQAGLPVQITHHKVMARQNWGQSVDTLAMIDEARARGIDITMDQYPYTAAQSGMTSIVPQWAQEGGTEALLEIWNSNALRQELKMGIVDRILYDRGGGSPANIVISFSAWDPSLEGMSLADIAVSRGIEASLGNAAEIAMDIISKGGATAVYHAMAEEDIERIMQHPATAIGSDGTLTVFGAGAPHPRQYGTFARVLGRYVRERGIITLENAVRKMSGATAQRLGIRDRGILREGYFADISIFNAAEIRDMATFEDPHQYAEGVDYVIINGTLALDEGIVTAARPGQIINGPGFQED